MSQASWPPAAPPARRWQWFLACGVVLLVLGVAGVGVSAVLEMTSLLVFGPLLLAAAGVQLLAAAFAARKEALLHLAASVLEAILGFWIMANPLENLTDVMAWVALFFLVTGLIRIGRSLLVAPPDQGRTISAGLVALLLGVCLWLRWPEARWWFVGLCIGIDFLVRGLSWSLAALAQKHSDSGKANHGQA